MSRSARRPRGATLAELIACLAIATVLLGISLPRYEAWRNAVAVREAGAELRSTLVLARETAVVRAGFVSVAMDSALGRVAINAGGRTIGRHDLALRYGVILSANRDSLVYDPRGLGYGAANTTMILRRGGAAETVTVSRMGRVR